MSPSRLDAPAAQEGPGGARPCVAVPYVPASSVCTSRAWTCSKSGYPSPKRSARRSPSPYFGAFDLVWHPIDSAKAIYNGVMSLINNLMNMDWSAAAQQLFPEIYQLITQWGTLSDYEKGELIGRIIFQYGVQIISAAGAARIVNQIRNLAVVKTVAGAAGKVGTAAGKVAGKVAAATGKVGAAAGNVARGIGKAAGAAKCKLTGTCFAAGTPLVTPEGHKFIDHFQVGDWILSAPEQDPEAEPTPQQVEDLFSTEAPLYNLRLGNRLIRTTGEHPFWVIGRGWTMAEDLKAGELLRSHDGAAIAVEGIWNTGETVRVYNLAVSEYHTYFVGSREWGFSAWAHNAGAAYVAANRAQGLARQAQLAALYASAGFKVTSKVKGILTPFGWRFYDLMLEKGGKIVYVEVKSGRSWYGGLQRLKDSYIKRVLGLPVIVVR